MKGPRVELDHTPEFCLFLSFIPLLNKERGDGARQKAAILCRTPECEGDVIIKRAAAYKYRGWLGTTGLSICRTCMYSTRLNIEAYTVFCGIINAQLSCCINTTNLFSAQFLTSQNIMAKLRELCTVLIVGVTQL